MAQLDSDKQLTIAELEGPRFQSCSFFPYSLNEDSEIVLLMRNKKGSKNPDYYVDFGTSAKESDPCILYSAARGYLKKCGGLCVSQEIPNLHDPSEVLRILKDNALKLSAGNNYEIYTNNKVQEIVRQFITNKSHIIFDVIAEEHLAIFFPLPYFELEVVNNVLSTTQETMPNSARIYMDLSFHWITLRQIADPDFSQNFITSFDQQIISNSAQNMTANLIGDQSRQIDYIFPDYAIMVCDQTPHLEHTAELNLLGQLVDSEERWEYYNAINFQRPSKKELKHLKGIIIPNSNHNILNMVPRDENIVKQFLKKGMQGSNQDQSDVDLKSSVASANNFDLAVLEKQAKYIIGDELIPQNEIWIEKLADLIRDIFENYKHIKLMGCQFGSQIIAYALGGKIERVPSLPENQKYYIGKEDIKMTNLFFQQPWVREVIEGIDEEEYEEVQSLGVYKVHSDMVSKLPDGAELLGSSIRTHNEIWSIPDRVLGIQSSPELNKYYIKELIITKLYETGKLDEGLRNQSIEQLEYELIPSSRHIILKCMNKFIKAPNKHLIKIHQEFINENNKKLKELESLQIVSGESIHQRNYSADSCEMSIKNGPTACAIDLVDQSRVQSQVFRKEIQTLPNETQDGPNLLQNQQYIKTIESDTMDLKSLKGSIEPPSGSRKDLQAIAPGHVTVNPNATKSNIELKLALDSNFFSKTIQEDENQDITKLDPKTEEEKGNNIIIE